MNINATQQINMTEETKKSSYFLDLLSNAKFTDITLLCNSGLGAKAHKNIISNFFLFHSGRYEVTTECCAISLPLTLGQINYILRYIYLKFDNKIPEKTNNIEVCVGLLSFFAELPHSEQPIIEYLLIELKTYLEKKDILNVDYNLIKGFLKVYEVEYSSIVSFIRNLLHISSLESTNRNLSEYTKRWKEVSTEQMVKLTRNILSLFVDCPVNKKTTSLKVEILIKLKQLDPNGHYMPSPIELGNLLENCECIILFKYLLTISGCICKFPTFLENKELQEDNEQKKPNKLGTINNKEGEQLKGTKIKRVGTDAFYLYDMENRSFDVVKHELSRYGEIVTFYIKENRYFVRYKDPRDREDALNSIWFLE